jgi:hypothetical protein
LVAAGAFPTLGGRHPFDTAEPLQRGVQVSVLVDGDLLLNPGVDYDLLWSEAHEPIGPKYLLVQALKRGREATVRIVGGHELTVSPNGSTQAIDTLLARLRLGKLWLRN